MYHHKSVIFCNIVTRIIWMLCSNNVTPFQFVSSSLSFSKTNIDRGEAAVLIINLFNLGPLAVWCVDIDLFVN